MEHIIIDGGSTDGTVEIIANASSVDKYISEPDEGIYDAMNKGLALAKGDIIGMLNADDFYETDDVLAQVAKVFERPDVDACYADLVYVKQCDTSKVVRYWKSVSYRPGLFTQGWMPAHPTFFCRKSAYSQFGAFDIDYKIAADVELLFRFLEKYRLNSVYLPQTLIRMRLGGTTNRSWHNIKTQNSEILTMLDKYYGHVNRFRFFWGKFCHRLSQFLLRP